MLAVITVITAFLGAVIVSAFVQVRCRQRGVGIWRSQWVSGLAGAATMIGVMAAYLLIGNLVLFLNR